MKVKFTKVTILELFDTVGHFNWHNWVHNKDDRETEKNNFPQFNLSISKTFAFIIKKWLKKTLNFFLYSKFDIFL